MGERVVETRILELAGTDADNSLISEAAAALREGMLVVFPTETVYGLCCCASRRDSVRRIYEIKGRPWGKPLAFYIASPSEVSRYASSIPGAARSLMARFWPGPLTILLARQRGGRIGFRCPGEKRALALIAEAGVPIVGTSANRSGCPCPLSGEEAAAAMTGHADLVLKGGATRCRRESTIVDMGGREPSIVREGVIARGEIESVLMRPCAAVEEHAR